MNFLTADVVIKADDSQLPAQLARAKTAVTRTVSAIKATYSKMAASFKAAFDKMVKYAKWAGLAIAGALTLATRAAMKQEDAQFLLAAALKISGEWTLKLQHRFNAFAASVQQATVYGDEEVLALMQLQKSLGVTSDKLEEAAKMSIGLATATGRDVQSMAMYVALAQQGEFTMLRRYIPALRSTTDATEQLKIVTEFAAAGFKLAEERAKTSSGALRQMRNALGDVAEVIGKAILPGLKDTAIAIKEWAERNQERIGRWAEIVVEKIKIVKDSLWALIKFMGTDWKKGIEYGLNVSKELFIGFGNSIYAILKHTFFRLANDVGGWTSQILEEMMVHSRAYGEKFRELVPWYSLGDRTKAKIEAEAYAEAQVQFYRKVKDQQRALELKDEKSLADELVKLAKETTNRIANIPKPKGYLEPPKPSPEISKGLGITALPFGGDISVAPLDPAAAAERLQKAEEERWQAQLKAYETQLGFLEDIQESEIARGEAAETAIQKQIDFTRNLDNMSAQERIRNLEDWGRANADILEIAGENAREFYDELKRLREEDKRGWDAVGESINRWVDKTSNWGARLGEVMTGALDDVSGALTDMIMGAEVDWKRLTRSILADLIQMIIRMQMAKALTAFGFGGVAHAGGIVGATPFPVRMVPAGTFENAPRLHSGLAADEYPAILQRGERVIPRGNGTKESGGGVTVNMPTEVRIHNEGSEKLVITKEESYMMGDQRIIDVTMKAAESDGRFRKTFGIGRR